MEKRHCDILVDLRQKIVDDLDVHNGIIGPLTTEYVLLDKDIEEIKTGKSKEKRAQILLDILPSCGPHAFGVFHEALRRHYDWLSGDIDRMLVSRNIKAVTEGRTPSPGSPNLPPQPSMNVKREAKMAQLKEALTNMEPGGYLALHGMKGFGKSCLTANTLKDRALVNTLFTNKVYWIKFGYERLIDDEILIQLNFLYHQVRNTDTLGTSAHSEPLKEQLMHSLKTHFSKAHNRDALLILDDVWSREIIDVFDFHCKTLVITTDSDLLQGKHPQIIEMRDGFTEAESLGLFAKVLQMDVNELPVEAKKIHEECKGIPILIAMFAAHFEEFKQDMRVNSNRWRYYLNSLCTRDPTNRVMEQFLSKQKVIFDMCIDRLGPDTKRRYESLAIFSEDVNIMPETLAILWDGSPFAVEEQMLDLCHKSLAAKHWNVDLKSYVYGVHDLLLCHLRERLGLKKLRNLHRCFVDKYRAYCNNDFSKLPKDNYSYSYIGHHLEQAEMYEEFPRLYLNFDFLRAKIYNTGLSDLLIDLKKYRELIIQNDPKMEENVADLEKFLESRAGTIVEQRKRKCLDLIQIGMNYGTKKYIYEKTREIASSQPSRLFLTHDGPIFTLSDDEIPTDGIIAFFTDDPDRILIGDRTGRVILWDCKTRLQSPFIGHDENSPVKKILPSCYGDYFLTLSENGQIQHYHLREDEHDRVMPSPREKQMHWQGLFGDKAPKVQRQFFIEDETITDMALCQRQGRSDRVGVCTASGTISVWTIDGEMIYSEKEKMHSFMRIAFSREGAIIHLINEKGVLEFYLEQYEPSTTPYSYSSMWNPRLQSQKVVFFEALPYEERSLIIVTDVAAVYVKWEEVCSRNHPYSVTNTHNFIKRSGAEVEDRNTRYTCAALTRDGCHLITSDLKGTVNVWIVKSSFEPIATFKGHVSSLDTYWYLNEFHLIYGCGKNVIYKWELALEDLPKSVRKPLFDAVMKPWKTENIVAKEAHATMTKDDNASVNAVTVNLYRGDTLIGKTEPIEGSIVRLSLNSMGDKILYVTDKWHVMLFDVSTHASTNLMKLTAAPSIATFVTVAGSTSVVCEEDNNLRVKFDNLRALVENTGPVTSIYTIDNEYVATVARNGAIQFWLVHETNWTKINSLKTCEGDECLCYSSMNAKGNFLGLLKANGEMLIHEITKNYGTNLPILEAEKYVDFLYNRKLTCCAFSSDDNYFAVGLENGDISIFDMVARCELNRLELHCNEIRELHWSPISIGMPILLSVNCDELAWWNVALLNEEKKENRRSRMGMSKSISSLYSNPRSSLRLTTSQSMGSVSTTMIANQLPSLEIQSANDNAAKNNGKPENSDLNGNYNPVTFWKEKTLGHPNRRALLSVVPLPPSCNSKICVSNDFSKFLSVDIHGIVSNFKFYNYDT